MKVYADFISVLEQLAEHYRKLAQQEKLELVGEPENPDSWEKIFGDQFLAGDIAQAKQDAKTYELGLLHTQGLYLAAIRRAAREAYKTIPRARVHTDSVLLGLADSNGWLRTDLVDYLQGMLRR